MNTSARGLLPGAKPCFRFFLNALALWGLAAHPSVAAPTGQLWWAGEGNPTDARIAYLNNDGGAQTVNTDNSPTVDLVTAFPRDLGLDTAAGFYFAIVNGSTGDNAFLVRGPIGGAAASTVVVDFPNTVIVNALHVDPINKRIYTTWQDGSGLVANNTGIRVYSYNPLTGVLTDLGFMVTAASDNKPSSNGYDVLDVRDFDIDPSTNTLYFTEWLAGVPEMGLYRMQVGTQIITQMVSSAQFPDSGSGGYIIDVEVDPTTDQVYFTTESQHAFGAASGYNAAQNKLWVVPQGASNATATEVTLSGLPAGSHIYPGDMVFDQSQRQLYIESEESDSISTDDVIYVFQLDLAGTAATWVRTITPSPAFTNVAANIQGMAFDAFATLSITGTTTHALQQSTPVFLLAADPTINDIDGGYLASATVAISGSFTGSGDDLFVLDGATHRNSGLITGTSITVARVTDGSGNQKLTLTGYDTLTHYQQALGKVQLFANSNNPTNSGNNRSRTITWQVNDGAAGNPAMTLNAASTNLRSTTLTIDAANSSPVAVDDTIFRYAAQSTNVGTKVLIANDTDVDGDDLIILSTGGAAHGTVSISAGRLYYTPTAGYTGGDSFTYAITDGHGGTATGTVTVTVIPGKETAKIESLTGGAWKISFTGIAGMNYRVQSSETLAPGSWVDRATTTASGLGEFSFTDSIPLPARRFYRCTPP